MTKANENNRSWHERAIDEKARRDAREGHYDPPASWFDFLKSSRQSAERDAYNQGWESAKAAVLKKLDLSGAFLRRTDLSAASLKEANLKGADFTNAIFRGADFEDAIPDGTILKGADLTGAKNLTLSQLRAAVLDSTTKLPEGFSISEIHKDQQQPW